MTWGAVAGAAIGVVGGALSSSSAAKKQQQAANEANRIQWEMFQQQRADHAPWREAGQRALGGLEEFMRGDGGRRFTMADYEADPGYAFRLREGESAINRNALARGRFNSGSVLKALQGYNSDLASQEFGNAFNRWQSQNDTKFNRLGAIAGIGQTATNQTQAASINAGNAMAGNVIGVGNAAAAGRIGVGNAIMGGIGQGINWWQSQRAMNALRQPGAGSGYGGWGGSYVPPAAGDDGS
ncbi:MAG: hypothetical protein MUC68_00315 [Burkholderiaceae bacterium]|jgi:type II secretory pathway pseudopilin PulG|nr:hypothetical protein [Burkholderiaceae bacterium]